MESRVDKAAERHKQGYNCAQAVACTYCDLAGIDEETMFKVTEAMGLGMGGMNGTCGAVTGACAIAGMLNSCGDLDRPVSKGATYKVSREISDRFLEETGSLTCRDIKGVDTGKILKSCHDCVKDAARILEEVCFKE